MENQENINELFKRFYGSDDAQKYIQDIADADKLFKANPPPEPGKDLIKQIKSKVDSAIAAKKRRQLRLSFIRLASAAAVIVLGFTATMTIVENRIKNNISVPIVEESDYKQIDFIASELTEAENYAHDAAYYANDNFFELEDETDADSFNLEG